MVVPQVGTDPSQCVIDAKRVTSAVRLIDLRARPEYAAYHPFKADNHQLAQLLSQRPSGIVVFDGGRLYQDAVLLCARLQSYGLNDVRVVGGGVSALARQLGAREALALSRLSDDEVAAALLSGNMRIQSLAQPHSQIVASFRISSAPRGQALILATDQTQITTAGNSVYWVGQPQRLRQLLQTSQLQERKREQGPGYNPNCAAL